MVAVESPCQQRSPPFTTMADFKLGPTSLHPQLSITPHSPGCRLRLNITLPDALFPDPSELLDKWPQPGAVRWTLSPAVVDIERPLDPYAESAVLVFDYVTGESAVDIPLHGRYLPPKDGGWDVSFAVKGTVDCGDGAQGVEHWVGVHLPAVTPGNQVPVEIATAAVVWLGWAWVAWKIVGVVSRSRRKAKTE